MAQQAQESVGVAKSAAEAKVGEAQEATERKVEDTKRLVLVLRVWTVFPHVLPSLVCTE